MDDYSSIILEMLKRIQKLENEVETLKQIQKETNDIIKKIDLDKVLTAKSDPLADYDDDEEPQKPTSYTPKMLCRTNFVPDEQPRPANKRDTTKYMFNGNIYLKNRLVLAIVCDYAKTHAGITRDEMKAVFSKSLQGSIGVVENAETVIQRRDYRVRFFAADDEILHLSDGDMYVCSQWGILNIPNFLLRANQLGYTITDIR